MYEQELLQECEFLRAEVERLKDENSAMTKKIYKLTRSRETLTEEKNSLAIEYNTRLATNTRLLNERAEQGEYLQLVLKNSEDIIMFLDKDARILYYAESFKRAVRVDKSAVLTGQKIYDVWEKFISVEDAAAAEARFQKTKDLRETIYENITISFIGENEARHFRTIYTPLIDVTGAFDGVLAIYYDSTQLIKALKHAEEANNAKNNFLISMSHEIRTPMNAIIGMGELIRTDNLDDVQKNYLQDIKKMSRSFLGIVNDILDFAKIEMGKIVLELTHYSLKRLFDNVCSLTQFTLADKHVEFSYYFDPALPSTLYGDEMRVRQILSNILNNAAKYTEHGDVSLKIEHQPHGEENGMLFVISDTGIGIKADTLAIMFEAFSSKQDMKKHGSLDTGLGLAITKRFVDLMGGTITVESEYGKGSVFTIWLPIHLGDESAVELSDSFDCVTASDDSRALVIDDNTINLSVARGFLMKHGIRADTAESGITGIEMTDKNDYDMIFMDHMMPEFDGVETTQLLRKKGFSKPIIALTANAIAGAREFFLANGMDDFIAKPIDAAVFNKVLLQWLPKNKIISTKRKQRHDCRVLVLDDSNGARKTLRRSLVGFNVIEKSSVDEFKTIKDNENFNIIILEPEIRGGFFVIDQIRKKNPETPIIAISRNSGIKEYCLSFGVSDFLAKPYKSGQLTDIIQRYLHE